MSQTIEAVYEQGLLKPLQPLDLPEHERVSITVEPSMERSPAEILTELPRQQAVNPEDARRALCSLIGLARSGNPHNADNEDLDATLAAVYAQEAKP